MAVPPAPDDRSGLTEETDTAVQDQRTPSHSLRLTLLVVLLALLLASTAAVAYLAATRPVPALGIEGSQDSLQGERENVMAQAEQFMLRINTYGPDLLEGDTMPKYRELVEEVITPKLAAEFEQGVPVAEANVKQNGLERSAEVYSTGVSAIDSDSATALVAGQISNTYPPRLRDRLGDLCPPAGDRLVCPPSGFRIEVSMVKIKDTWLVDEFQPVAGEEGTGGALPDTGTEAPSEGVSP